MIRVRAPRELAAGCTFLVIAAFFLWFGRHLPVGSASFMEAGYFPRLASTMLAVLGLVIVANALRVEGEGLAPWAWRPLLILNGAVALFGFLIGRAGLVVTTAVVVILASFAGRRLGWGELALLALALIVLMVALFHYGLDLPIPVWPR
jgi:hypothetical protein